MRIIKDPFTGDLLMSLDSFESKQVKDKGYIKISTKTNFFGYLKILHDDLSAIITEELRSIQLNKEKTKNAKIRNKSKINTSNS
jgi:hypothetical protein|tara:strand:+ start:3711 stop:3962 length:252 start_codon:yes stop_codon:yes gene_type:complete